MFYDGRIDYTHRGVVSMAADWAKIKTEYISASKKVSYRKLAKKYGVPESSLFAKASEEQWVEQREQFQSKTIAKSLDAISNATADRAVALMEAADLLLERTINGISTYRELPATAAKNYSDALKNIKEIHMIRSSEDIEEQKARIAKLQKEAKEEDKAKTITVTLEGDMIRYAK